MHSASTKQRRSRAERNRRNRIIETLYRNAVTVDQFQAARIVAALLTHPQVKQETVDKIEALAHKLDTKYRRTLS